jgi:hypothetical protein
MLREVQMTQRNRSEPLRRVCARPDPAAWREDELMTLGEAAALFWPDGPLTETTLRTAVRDQRLSIAKIAGKFFTTKRAIAALAICRPLAGEEGGEGQPRARYVSDLREIAEMGRCGKR